MDESKKMNNIDSIIDYSSSKLVCAELLSKEIIPFVAEGEKEAGKRKDKFIAESFNSFVDKNLNPDEVKQSFADPSMQIDFINAANGYIKYGEDELLGILSDMLSYRIKEKEKNVLQVALSEAIKVCPLLMNRHMVTLAIRFLLAHSRKINIKTIEEFVDYFNCYVIPLFNIGAAKEQSDFQHLNYTRCATTTAFSNDILSIIKENYKNVFCKGLGREEIGKEGEQYILDKYRFLFKESWADQNRFVPLLDSEQRFINPVIKTIVKPESYEKIVSILKGELLPDSTIKEKLKKEVPGWEVFEKYWRESGISNLNLSSVGIVIGAIYSSKISGDKIDLSIWIK